MSDFLKVKSNNLVFLKAYNKECDDIIIIFTNQNGRVLESGHKINLILPINK